MKILLACSSGMSTSLVERALKDYAARNNIELEVIAKGAGEARQEIDEYDLILLGPQVAYELESFQKQSNGTPIAVMDRFAYATANAKVIFEQINSLIKDKK